MKSGGKWTNICSKKRSDEVEKLLKELHLGKLLETPRQLQGGLMHRMDKVVCESGTYAVKTLNPHIMKRPEACRNMVISEKIAAKMKSVIPAVGALSFQGQQLLCNENAYYMVFPWQEGGSIYPPCITPSHCERMGDVLGRIHAADVQVDGLNKECPKDMTLDWDMPLSKMDDILLEAECRKSIPQLETWLQNARRTVRRLSVHQVISHRDLDPKNVLWQGDEPWLIDWEAAGYINPYQELMENLYYWADDGCGGLKESRFHAFLNAYEKHVSLKDAPWPDVFHACFMAPLEWLHYNLRRACGLEGAGEKAMGREQVGLTLKALHQLEDRNRLANAWLNKRT